MGATGYCFGYSACVVSLVNRLSTLSQVTPPDHKLTARVKQSPGLDQLVAPAARLAPAGHLYAVQLPAVRRAAITFSGPRRPMQPKADCDYLYFEQYSGEYIRRWRRGVSASVGDDDIVNSLAPLLFGTCALHRDIRCVDRRNGCGCTPRSVFALSNRGVSTEDGFTSVTRTGEFSCRTSTRRESIHPFKACLDAQYAPCRGTPRSLNALPIRIRAPATDPDAEVLPLHHAPAS